MPDPTDETTILEGTMRDWRDVMLRLQQLTRNDAGACVLEMRILCVRGQPAYWFAPVKRPIEPAASARAFCATFDGAGVA